VVELLLDGATTVIPAETVTLGANGTPVTLAGVLPGTTFIGYGPHTVSIALRSLSGATISLPAGAQAISATAFQPVAGNDVTTTARASGGAAGGLSSTFSTSSTSFVTVPGLTANFNASFDGAVVTATLNLIGPAGTAAVVELLLDGATTIIPAETVQLGTNGTPVTLAGVLPGTTFIGYGPHTISIAVRSLSGATISLPAGAQAISATAFQPVAGNDVTTTAGASGGGVGGLSSTFSTSSTSFVTVPGLTANFNASLDGAVVTATLNLTGPAGAAAVVELLLDGATTIIPAETVTLGANGTPVSLGGVLPGTTFIGSGPHTISIAVCSPSGATISLPAGAQAISATAFAPVTLPTPTLTNGGLTLVTPNQTLSGLNVSRQVTVPNTGSQDFARTVDYFQNPTSSPITTTVHIVGNLGSDAATRVFATSSGDSLPSPSDEWFGTDSGPGTAAVISVVHGPYGLIPTSEDIVGDNFEWTYTITVQPGQTLELGSFTILASSDAAAIAEANALLTLNGFGGHAADSLSSPLANFDFLPAITSVSPAPGSKLNAQNTSLQVNFSTFVVNAGQAASYELRGAGPDGLFGTADDVLVPATPSYSGTTATLSFNPLTAGAYRLTVFGNAITSPGGINLDGNGDGIPGRNYVGSFTMDGPTVTGTNPSLPGGPLPAGQTSLQVNFTEPVVGADQVSNYQLQSVGPDGLLGTADDVITPLSVSYTGTTTTLTFSALPSSVYRLTAMKTITDAAGNQLDGNGTGTPGSNYVRDFVVMATPTTPLTSPNGFVFDPAMGGYGAGQLIQGTGNAFDGLNRLQVGGADFSPTPNTTPSEIIAQFQVTNGYHTTSTSFNPIASLQNEFLQNSATVSLATSVTLASSETVRLDAELVLRADNPNAPVGLEFLVDGVAASAPRVFFPNANDNPASLVNYEEEVTIPAETHAVDIAWASFSGAYIDVLPSNFFGGYPVIGTSASLTVTIAQTIPSVGPAVTVAQSTVVNGYHTTSSSFNPIASQGNLFQQYSSTVSLATSVNLSTAQTVRLDAELALRANAPNVPVGLEFLVDGVAATAPRVFFPNANSNPADLVNYEEAVTIPAGTHTVDIAWASFSGAYVDVLPTGYFGLYNGMSPFPSASLNVSIPNTIPSVGPAVTVAQSTVVNGYHTTSSSFNPIASQGNLFQQNSSAVSLATSVTLSTAQTVRLDAELALRADAPNVPVGLEFLVDGVAATAPRVFFPTVNSNPAGLVNYEEAVNIPAGTHTVDIAWASFSGAYVDVLPTGYFGFYSGMSNFPSASLSISIPGSIPIASLSNSGQTLITPTATLAGLNVSRQVTVPNTGSQDFARTMDYFQNPRQHADHHGRHHRRQSRLRRGDTGFRHFERRQHAER
jgi:hypothetical protein